MDDFILTLAIRWLAAVDACSASCVSREWHSALSSERQGGDVWKQVCHNTNRFVVQAMENQHNVDYRLLAIGLGRSFPTLLPSLRPPQLDISQLFAVVDLYRHKKLENGKRQRVIEASWVCPIQWKGDEESFVTATNIGFDSQDDSSNQSIITGANPYAAQHVNCKHVQEWRSATSRYSQKSPLHYAAYDILGTSLVPSKSQLRSKVTLFRRDNMKSVCVLDEDINDCATGGDEDPAEEVVRFYYHNRESLRFANNEAGQNARLLGRKRIFTKLTLDGEFYLKAILPEPDSEEEYEWLANSRHAVRTLEEDELYCPDAKDEAELRKIESFQYEVKRFSFAFRVSTGTYCCLLFGCIVPASIHVD